MKIELADVSGLPDALKPLAVSAEGKTTLDLSALVPATDFDKVRARLQTAESEAIDRRKALKAYEAYGTAEEIAAKLAKGADPQIVDQLRAQIAEKETAGAARVSKVLRDAATANLKAELAAAGVVPEALDMLAAFVAPRLAHDDNDNLRILAEDGKTPMLGTGPNGGATLKDFAASLAKASPHLVRDPGKGGGGANPGGGGGGAGKTMTRSDFDRLDPATKAGRMKDGYTLTD